MINERSQERVVYRGPRKIVIIGGGLGGLAAFDAVTRALASCSTLPEGIEVTLVEANEALGGRASSEWVLGPSERHPHAPHAIAAPHGVHFIWGGYTHTYRLLGPELVATLTPRRGTSTYCLWLAPPDIPGDRHSPARVVALHVCDPSRPDDAWRAPARVILRAIRRHASVATLIEKVLLRVFGFRVKLHELSSYMDVLFDEEHIGPELRWTMFLTGAITATMGAPETNRLLRLMLQRSPQDAEIGELVQPVFADWLRSRLDGFARVTDVFGLRHGGGGPGGPDAPSSSVDALRALSELTGLVARDTARLAARAGGHDPRSSGYIKNILKAAFSSPYGLDVATALRDAQFGLRNYEGAALQLFDGDDSSAVWRAIVERALALARADGRFVAELRCPSVAARIQLDEGRQVRAVELAPGAERAPPDVPTLRPARPAPTTAMLPADAVIAAILPACLAEIVPDAPETMLDDLRELGRHANDTLNLQLFMRRRVELPFPAMPAGATETPPFSISNIEGPFTILVDLRRGWSREKFRAIRLTPSDPKDAFDGTAWELVGNYADLFSHDQHAHAGRHQWPLAVQQQLAHWLHDPDEIDPAVLDTRMWHHDCGAPGRLLPPLFGEIVPQHRRAYQERWSQRAGPLIVAETLRQLAAMPGMEEAAYLRAQARAVLRGHDHEVRWVLTRNCHAENRFFSAEPGLFHRRPHARFETQVAGLWVAGDWTRNGLNVQAMEPAIISGLQAAAGLLERMRASGLPIRELPRIDPSVLPEGAWDGGPEL